MITKSHLAAALGVSPAAVGQWESGVASPRVENLQPLADALDVPSAFFATGRPSGLLSAHEAHFRSLRSTTVAQRSKALAFTEQIWELVFSLEKRVRFPDSSLPMVEPTTTPKLAARLLREHWQLGEGPIPHVVRTIENHGIVVVFTPVADEAMLSVDAFSTSRFERPIIVLSRNRADDVYRHRFTAAHELGHLLLHTDHEPGDAQIEREADQFAAEFLTPGRAIEPKLDPRLNWRKLAELSGEWGVSVQSLVYRSRELGLFSDATARRAYIRLQGMRTQSSFAPQPIDRFEGEIPVLLGLALEQAGKLGLTTDGLAAELAWKPAYLQRLLGRVDTRPALRLV